MMHSRYGKDSLSARQAQEMAHIIAFGPVIFQVSRVMLDYGIFDYLRSRTDDGATVGEVAQAVCITDYAAKVLLESSLTLGTVLCNDGRYSLSKVGWFFLTDPMVKVNMDFNYDINYKGMFHLEEALVEGRPAGLAELGPWKTIYEGLSLLSPQQQSSWFSFDHFYSDSAFDDALPKVFASAPSRILDIGGNTGKWAMKCVGYSKDVMVTVADLPGQISMLEKLIAGQPGADRVDTFSIDILDRDSRLPYGYDAVWMSQFLDCFSDRQVVDILMRVTESLNPGGRVFIMETLWDRQKYTAASFDLAQTSVYFTAMANGNSKMFNSEDLMSYIRESGLEPVSITDGLGYAHSLIECTKSDKRRNN